MSLEAAQGSNWTNFIHPDDVSNHVLRWRQAMSTGEPATSQARVRIAGGEYRWMLHHTEPLRDSSGNIVRWFGSSLDIEQLKRVEQELHDLKERPHKENIALRDEISQTSMFTAAPSRWP